MQANRGGCHVTITSMTLQFIIPVIAALFAGFIDSIVGGGGLIQLPVLLATYPATVPATLFGTNKSASIWGTLMASTQYARRVRLRWQVLGPAAFSALVGSFFGAWAVTQVDPTFLRKLLPFVLAAVLAYTFFNKHLGSTHELRYSGMKEVMITALIGLVIGFYDGFFGPGTGSFFIFLLVRVMGYDFLNASASAKVLNVATNLAALTLFVSTGHIWWQIGAAMAVANVLGSIFGSRLALKHGTAFVRTFFLIVVTALIIKTAYDALHLA